MFPQGSIFEFCSTILQVPSRKQYQHRTQLLLVTAKGSLDRLLSICCIVVNRCFWKIQPQFYSAPSNPWSPDDFSIRTRLPSSMSSRKRRSSLSLYLASWEGKLTEISMFMLKSLPDRTQESSFVPRRFQTSEGTVPETLNCVVLVTNFGLTGISGSTCLSFSSMTSCFKSDSDRASSLVLFLRILARLFFSRNTLDSKATSSKPITSSNHSFPNDPSVHSPDANPNSPLDTKSMICLRITSLGSINLVNEPLRKLCLKLDSGQASFSWNAGGQLRSM